MFVSPFPNAFGLDIGDLSIKLVQLRNLSYRFRKPTYDLISLRSISLPHGLIVNGELIKPEEVRHYIEKLLHGKQGEKPIKSPWVVSSLPEKQGFMKLISLHKPAEDIIEDDIIIESKKHIPFEEDGSYYLDWQIVPSEEDAQDVTYVLIGAIPKLIADSYTYLLESLGLGVMALEIEALSIARTLITAEKKYEGEARALLDIGATRSSLVLYDHDKIQFSTSFPYSGELLTTALTQQFHVEYEQAEDLKKKNGLSYSKGVHGWDMCMKLTLEFANDIQKDLQFYYSHFNNTNRVTHITMCGGGSTLLHLEEVLSTELKIECKQGNVWKNLFTKSKIEIPFSASLGYATSIGLALRAADNPFFKYDTI
jgi:type IV pilus assembly protein PilM